MDDSKNVDSDVIPETPEVLLKSNKLSLCKSKRSTSLQNSSHKNKNVLKSEKCLQRKQSSKRKVNFSPDVNKVKNKSAKQIKLTNFVTRLKRSSSNEEMKPLPSKNLLNCFNKMEIESNVQRNCSLYKDSGIFCSQKIPVVDIPDNEEIVAHIDVLKLGICTNLKESCREISAPSSVYKHKGQCQLETLDEAVHPKNDNTRTCHEFDNSFSWLADVDFENLENQMSPLDGSHTEHPLKSDNYEEISTDEKYKVTEIKRKKANELELTLQGCSNGSSCSKQCILRGFWAESILNVGDTVNVLAPFIKSCAVINDETGFLVINPNYLISSTAVVSTLFCMRKAALSLKFRQWDSSNIAMLVGSLVHQVFQQVVNDHKSTEKDVEDVLTKIIQRTENLVALYCQKVSEAEAKEYLSAYISSICQWISQYCAYSGKSASKADLQVTEVRDIEDSVWCPRYGIKGKIDLTVKVAFQKENIQKLMPLEVKTGVPSFSAEHKGQVNLYTLMMEDRTEERSDGLLLYLKGSAQMKQIPADHNARRGLIQLRNELAHYTQQWSNQQQTVDPASEEQSFGNCYLPDPIDNKKLCQKCSYLFPCSIYQRAYKGKEIINSHAMFTLVPNATNHLPESNFEYFRKWSYLLFLESESSSNSKCFWNEDAHTREKDGFCFSDMVLRDDILTQQEKEGGVYVHSFFRAKDSTMKSELLSIGLKPGDYIVVSNQRNSREVALATGYIVEIAEHNVKVSVERNIQELTRYEGYLFRLDKQSPSTAGSSSYLNLMKLMTCEEIPAHLRELIIDRKPPEFLLTMSKNIAVRARPILKSLNKPQRKAIFKALMAKDYMLLKGMPGTGKTATLVAMVRLLVDMGNRVFLTSHTHSAVDNVLLKLCEHQVDFLRIGQLHRIHPDVQPYSFEVLINDMTKVNELSELIQSKMVVASTCLGINHPVLKTLNFDVCIVDEASQVTQLDCLGPLFFAKKFILAGDPKQLPPVVVNKQARQKGMQDSLFSELETSDNCMELVLQYRMNREVMRLCSELSYGGKMECGSTEIETSVLEIDTSFCRPMYLPENLWLSMALSCQLENSALFLNTDDIPALESSDNNGRIYNDVEKQLVLLLIQHMIQAGLKSEDIGVITPYRCQVELLSNSLKGINYSQIEVNTVDQYQGKDKDAIIISCVRSRCDSTEENRASTIIGDERRLNVAISRAKKKLITIGSKSTLMHYDCFERFFGLLRPEQVLTLPTNAHIVHNCN